MQLGTFLITSPITLTPEMGISGVNFVATTGSSYTITGTRTLVVAGVKMDSVPLTKTDTDAPQVYQSISGEPVIGITITPTGTVQMQIEEV